MNKNRTVTGPSVQKQARFFSGRICLLAFATLGLAACAAHSRTTAQIEAGGGAYQVNIDGIADDSTSAGLFGLAFETVPRTKVGGGVRVRGIASSDDLEYAANTQFGTVFVSDGEASQGDWFLHATYDNGDDRRRLPFRFGMGIHNFEVESATLGGSQTWTSVGPQIEFAPRLPLSQSESSTLAFQGLLGLGYGLTSIEASDAPEQFDTTAVFFDFGIGLGAAFERAYFDVGYRYISSQYDESDPSGGFLVPQTDASFSGVVFTFGARF